MTYRDERDALHARNESLERELAALRADLAARHPQPPARAARPALAALGIVAAGLGFAALCMRAPAPAPSPRHAPPAPPAPPARPAPPTRPALPPEPVRATPPSPLAELAHARSGTTEPIARVYRGVVTRASQGAPVRANTACTVRLRRAGNMCFVDARCGDWGPYPNFAVTVCTIDDQGLPHGGIHMGPTTGQPTAIEMDGTRFELSDERPGSAYLLTLRLDEVNAEPLAAGGPWSAPR